MAHQRTGNYERSTSRRAGYVSIGTIYGAQEREHDGVITPEGDQTGVVLPVSRQRNERLTAFRIVSERREWGTVQEFFVSLLNLLNGVLVVTDRFELERESCDT